MKFLVLSLLLSMNITFAKEVKKTSQVNATKAKQMSELGKIDSKTLDLEPQKKEEEIADDTPLVMNPSDVKVNFSCKAKDGHEIKQGEAGYEECLQKVKNDKHNPNAPGADLKVNFKK